MSCARSICIWMHQGIFAALHRCSECCDTAYLLSQILASAPSDFARAGTGHPRSRKITLQVDTRACSPQLLSAIWKCAFVYFVITVMFHIYRRCRQGHCPTMVSKHCCIQSDSVGCHAQSMQHLRHFAFFAGTCKHYRKSFRWLRFPCCGQLAPTLASCFVLLSDFIPSSHAFRDVLQANATPATLAMMALRTILPCGLTECCVVSVGWSSLFHQNRAAVGRSWPRAAP
jgi:hypothetical protein